MDRKIWVQMGLLVVYEAIAESMWRAMEWVCEGRAHAVLDTFKKCFQMEKYKVVGQCNHTRWKHKWCGTIVGTSGTKLPRTGRGRNIG